MASACITQRGSASTDYMRRLGIRQRSTKVHHKAGGNPHLLAQRGMLFCVADSNLCIGNSWLKLNVYYKTVRLLDGTNFSGFSSICACEMLAY